MALILISSLLFSQIAISLWKKYHPRSYNLTTLLGLWLVPPVLGYRAGNYRYVTVWVLFSIANSFVVKKAMENPMKSGTPGVVYRWYTWVYNISYAVGIVGYVIMIVTFFHVPILAGMARETEENIFTGAITLLFYGLYFGTLGRDFVDRLSDRMATTMGYYSRTGFPAKHLRSNQCAICGEVTDTSGGAESRQIGIGTGTTPKGTVVKVHRLTCGHAFHEQCIRGWTIIGKKDVCPCCKEKVDLKAFKTNPWDTTQQMYLNLLDALRYMVV
ncbi:hypothetical protein HK097_011302 [Rhizophlyctis rosea]|uniref:RING-type domain-containing protein n=1 Tax=Rhizophlyctis rosea TaxID=64517 RepID=A0AAD5X1Z9_9FUNG|nr:hypothetical protein HK097_011302 [Rhizophlyctis rosea]